MKHWGAGFPQNVAQRTVRSSASNQGELLWASNLKVQTLFNFIHPLTLECHPAAAASQWVHAKAGHYMLDMLWEWIHSPSNFFLLSSENLPSKDDDGDVMAKDKMEQRMGRDGSVRMVTVDTTRHLHLLPAGRRKITLRVSWGGCSFHKSEINLITPNDGSVSSIRLAESLLRLSKGSSN
jgi:hypothetical protein